MANFYQRSSKNALMTVVYILGTRLVKNTTSASLNPVVWMVSKCHQLVFQAAPYTVHLKSSLEWTNSDSKVPAANMGPSRVPSAPDGPMLSPWTLLSGKNQYSIHPNPLHVRDCSSMIEAWWNSTNPISVLEGCLWCLASCGNHLSPVKCFIFRYTVLTNDGCMGLAWGKNSFGWIYYV